MSPTDARDEAIALAKTDTATALVRARAIADPWFRSQAIAWIARFAAAAEVAPILKEARESSQVAEGRVQNRWFIGMANAGHDRAR
ncbi:MAG TPA: hypothetical protein VJ790_13620 [Dongiaceae bacterium]|nr:hypothetical protein [Dongiaceae bacterium]